MNTLNYSFATLFEFALPTHGAYANVIGTVAFGDYKTLVMTQTAETTIGKNTYRTVQGYVLVKPLAEQFQKTHTDAKLKRIDNWVLCNKKLIASLQS